MGRRSIAAALLAVAFVLASGTSAGAQANNRPAAPVASGAVNTGNGLRISPVRYDLVVEPGKSQTIEVNVENITDLPAELRGVVNDFIASEDESGRPRVIFDENDRNLPAHSLRRYVPAISNFKLNPRESKTIKVTIAMPKDAAAGGYYGAVRFLPTTVGSSRNVNLTASVGSLLLVTVPGDLKEQLSIASLNVRRGENGKASTLFTNGNDLRMSLRFKNEGNVQLAPFGKVIVKKGDKEVASYEINSTVPRGTALPDSIRRFDVQMGDKLSEMGKYTLLGNFGYGSRGQLLTATTTIYVVPLPYVLLAAGLLVLIILAAVLIPKMLKEHDRRLIKRMRGGKLK